MTGAPAPTAQPTPSQTVGPYLSIGLRPLEHRQVADPGAPGGLTVEGRLFDGVGAPVPDGVVEIWDPSTGFGRCLTDAEGRFGFVTGRPVPVPLASGQLQAPHLDVLVFARGLTRWLRTRLYLPGEPANETDPVLAAVPADRRSTLVGLPLPPAAEGDPASGPGGAPERLQFDIRLQGDGETVFFAG